MRPKQVKIENKNFAVQGERLSAREPEKAMQQSELHRNEDVETGGTETTSSLLDLSRGNSLGTREQLLDRKVVEPRGITKETAMEKLPLIDLDAAMQTRRNQKGKVGMTRSFKDRERLSGVIPGSGECDSLGLREMNRKNVLRSGNIRAKESTSNKRQVHDWKVRASYPSDREFPGSPGLAERCSDDCHQQRATAHVPDGLVLDSSLNQRVLEVREIRERKGREVPALSFPFYEPDKKIATADTDNAYLAGILDGEGTFSIASARDHRDNVCRQYLSFQIGTTDLMLLLWIQSRWGGTIYLHKARNVKHKEAYVLQWSPKYVESIAKSAMPYLKLKKPHMEILLEWVRETWSGVQGAASHRQLTPEKVATREKLRGELMEFNVKGPRPAVKK